MKPSSPLSRPDYFLLPFGMDAAVSMAGLMVNLKAQDLGATPMQLGLLGVAWGVPFALFCLLTAWITRRFDRRLVLVAGAFLYASSILLYSIGSSPLALILSATVGGTGSAVFWPVFETLLHADDPRETQGRVGLFNVGWTLGLMGGSAAAGYYYRFLGPIDSFRSIGVLIVCLGLYIAWRTRRGIPPVHAEAPLEVEGGRMTPERRVGYMRMAWVANFALWFAGSITNTIFPKFARSMEIGDGPIGLLIAVVLLAQSASFTLFSRTPRWHYRFTPIVAMQVLGAAGLLVLSAGSVPAVFVAGLAMMGFGRGLTYTASLYYSLQNPSKGGTNAGLHEAIIGLSFILGPLAAGAAAEWSSLRLPFVLGAIGIVLGLAAQAILWRRLPEYR